MASLIIHDRSGKQVGTYQIEPADLAPRISSRLLHQAVVAYQAGQRQGTFRSKSRADVRGSTKKMYRQKGTGNARAGSRRSGVRRGGGHIFAKRPRDFSQTLPRKAARAATRMALASKIRDEQIVLIDQLKFDAPATREMAAILKALKCQSPSLLVTTENYDPSVYKSARNIAGVTVSPMADLNALSVIQSRLLLMTPAVLDALRAAGNGKQPKPGQKPKKKKSTAE